MLQCIMFWVATVCECEVSHFFIFSSLNFSNKFQSLLCVLLFLRRFWIVVKAASAGVGFQLHLATTKDSSGCRPNVSAPPGCSRRLLGLSQSWSRGHAYLKHQTEGKACARPKGTGGYPHSLSVLIYKQTPTASRRKVHSRTCTHTNSQSRHTHTHTHTHTNS